MSNTKNLNQSSLGSVESNTEGPSVGSDVRLLRLEGFLAQDMSNEALLADAHETAVSIGAFEKARQFLQRGYRLTEHTATWRLREAAALAAEGLYSEAKTLLLELNRSLGHSFLVSHELASIAFREARYEECAALIKALWQLPVMPSDAGEGTIAFRLQALWLRAVHQLGDLKEAISWVIQLESESWLHPDVAGVASLIAVDAGRFDLALRWADQALRHDAHHLEALNARAATALAQKDIRGCKQLAECALEKHPNEGRAWSTLGIAQLAEQDLSSAQASLRKAVQCMPTHIGSWHGLGWAHLLQDDFDGALHAFDQALALDRNFSESHGGKAVVLALMGQKEQAQYYIDLAIGLDSAALSGQYAAAILRGAVFDIEQFNRLADRLLGSRVGFFGESALDWVKHPGF